MKYRKDFQTSEDVMSKLIRKSIKEFIVIEIFLTGKCNLNCEYCPYKGHGGIDQKDLSINVKMIKKSTQLIEKLSRIHETTSVMITGGEPFMEFEKLMVLLKELNKIDNLTEIKILTNGTLITKKFMETIKKNLTPDFFNKIIFTISLDDFNKTDYYPRIFSNGLSSLELTLKGINELKKYTKNIEITITVGPHNVRRLSEIIENIMREISPIYINISYPKPPLSKMIKNIEHFSRTFVEELIKSIRLTQKYGIHIDFIDRAIQRFVNRKTVLITCHMGNTIVIKPDGRILACPWSIFLDEKTIKSFMLSIDSSVDEIEKFLFNIFTKISHEFSPLYNNHCKTCEFKDICGGGCYINAHYLKSDVDPIYCNTIKNFYKLLKSAVEQ